MRGGGAAIEGVMGACCHVATRSPVLHSMAALINGNTDPSRPPTLLTGS